MDLLIFRHGEADPRQEGVPDESRALIKKGRDEVRTVAEFLDRVRLTPDLILSSPLLRARQTAEIAANVFAKAFANASAAKRARNNTPPPQIIETDHLLPSALPDDLWEDLERLNTARAAATPPAQTRRVLLAGHEPHLSALASFVLEFPLAVDFKKGGVIRIQTANPPAPPHGVLKWMLTPKLIRRGMNG